MKIVAAVHTNSELIVQQRLEKLERGLYTLITFQNNLQTWCLTVGRRIGTGNPITGVRHHQRYGRALERDTPGSFPHVELVVNSFANRKSLARAAPHKPLWLTPRVVEMQASNYCTFVMPIFNLCECISL